VADHIRAHAWSCQAARAQQFWALVALRYL